MQALLELATLLAFIVAYYLHGLYVATAVLMVAMAVLLALDLAREQRIPAMHGLSAALVFAFGSATLLLHNRLYIQWKPTVFFWLASGAFLLSFWVGERTLAERLLGRALGPEARVPAPVWRRLNALWVVFAAALGAVNLAVAYHASERAWVNFKVIGVTLATAVFVAAQSAWLTRRSTRPGDAPGAAARETGIAPSSSGR
ncbi:MAG TPA: inner membrane-spanning protein YciB [Steroidobacteraceae bacterium]|nr:inner membrane-spanning protein YciB [Steroidobacteraceae bacterium]